MRRESVEADPSLHGSTIVGALAGSVYNQFRRPLLKGVPHATRVKLFHSKLNDPGFARLCDEINEWIDHNPEVEIKWSTNVIGVMEGKHPDPHLIITLYY
jgi:hypothetical protein